MDRLLNAIATRRANLFGLVILVATWVQQKRATGQPVTWWDALDALALALVSLGYSPIKRTDAPAGDGAAP